MYWRRLGRQLAAERADVDGGGHTYLGLVPDTERATYAVCVSPNSATSDPTGPGGAPMIDQDDVVVATVAAPFVRATALPRA